MSWPSGTPGAKPPWSEAELLDKLRWLIGTGANRSEGCCDVPSLVRCDSRRHAPLSDWTLNMTLLDLLRTANLTLARFSRFIPERLYQWLGREHLAAS